MKKENKLVIKLLDALAAKHSHMSFLYGFDEWANQHVIEVTPTESYKNEQYVMDEVDAIEEFVSNFPYQGILFLSNDPYLKVENPIYDTSATAHIVKPARRSVANLVIQRTSGTRLPK
jgi:uncharacterized membrane protein YkgB